MGNQFVSEFLSRMEARYAVDRSDMSLGDWICENTTINGKPFTFEKYPFQKQIADDEHPNLTCIKCSQVGLTEVQVRKFLAWLRRLQPIGGIYTLPNEKMFKRVSKTRLLPILENDKAFNLEGEEKAQRSMDLVQVGNSFGYVTGATEGDATSIPADILMHDEIDITDQAMVGLFQSRLQDSDYKITQRFGTPTWVEFGVDAHWRLTDQYEYMIKCPACNHNQIPDFTRRFVRIPGLPDHVEELTDINETMIHQLDLINSEVVCENCEAPLDLGNSGIREWVQRHPTRTNFRGYKVRPFSGNRITVPYIVTQLLSYQRLDYIRGFYNTVLGAPHTDSNARLEEDDIRACFTEYGRFPTPSEGTDVFIGIDVGLTCHLVLGCYTPDGKPHVFHFETLPANRLVERVSEVCDKYQVIAGACDRHPYTPTAEDVMEVSKGKVLPVEYRGTVAIKLIEDIEDSNRLSHAQANRTMMLDAVAKPIRTRKLAISGYGGQEGIIITHLRDMIRDEKPETPANWLKLNGNDHYFHAMAFLLLSMKMHDVMTGNIDEDVRSQVVLIGADVPIEHDNLYGMFNKSSLHNRSY